MVDISVVFQYRQFFEAPALLHANNCAMPKRGKTEILARNLFLIARTSTASDSHLGTSFNHSSPDGTRRGDHSFFVLLFILCMRSPSDVQ